MNEVTNGIPQNKKSPPVLKVEPFTGDDKEPVQELLSDFDYLLITAEKQIPQDIPTITINGAAFATPHNISVISGPPKGAKTAITGAMIAASISNTGEADGFTDIKALPNSERKAVLNFGTEQSEADEQYNLVNILKRADIATTPDFLRCYNIRQLDYKNYKEVTDTICELSCEKFGGIHSIFIDGGADYISSVNDEKESTEIIQYFTHLSIKYNCPVVIIVHQNPGIEKKERGHFGSQVQRKCYGLVVLEKKGELFIMQPKFLRRAGNGDMPLINFQYCKLKGYHVQIEAQDSEREKLKQRRQYLQDVVDAVFMPPNSFLHKEAVSKIMQHTDYKERTAREMLKDMEGFEFLIIGPDKRYRKNV